MTTIYYSKTNGGFYSTELHGDRTIQITDPAWTAPADDPDAVAPTVSAANPACTLPAASELVEITDAQYAALLDGQSEGKIIALGASGQPVLTDPAAPTTEQLAATLRAKRNVLLDQVVARLQRQQLQKTYGQATALTDEQAAQLATYAQALRDVPQQSSFPQSIVWPDAPTLTTTATKD